jgi:hypothetical protein
VASVDLVDRHDLIPLSTTSEFPVAQPERNPGFLQSPSYTFVPPLDDYISTTRPFSVADCIPRIDEGLGQNHGRHYYHDQHQPLLHPTTYHEPSLTVIQEEGRSYTMPTSWARRIPPDPLTKSLTEDRDPNVKQEIPDDYEAIHQYPSVRRSIFTPAASQEYLQMSDMDDWYNQR